MKKIVHKLPHLFLLYSFVNIKVGYCFMKRSFFVEMKDDFSISNSTEGIFGKLKFK